MASSSQAATCNGGDVSSTFSRAEVQRAMWNRMIQAKRELEAYEAARTHTTELQIERRFPSFRASPVPSAPSSENQKAMWNRMIQVEIDINKADRAAGTHTIELQIEKRFPSFRASPVPSAESFENQKAISNRLLQAMRDLEAFKAALQALELLQAMYSRDSCTRFKSVDFEISNDLLRSLEGQQANSMLSSPRVCFFLSNLLVSDIERNWESRFLKLFWRHSTGISDDDLLLFLSKLAEHYSPSDEVDNLEEFMLTNEETAKFLYDCSILDKASRLAMDFNEFSLRQTQGQKPQYWTRRDHTLHSVSFSESVKPLEVIFPFSTRFETAKDCFDRLDLLKSVAADLNPDESDTLASVFGTFKSPELQALHALKKEMELHGEVALQMEQLSSKHQRANEELSKDQLERPDEFFLTCQDEKRNAAQEALYKKVKCLASIKKVSINRQLKPSSEDLLKGIIRKTGSALKEVEGKLKKAQSSEEVYSKECTLCSSKFSKKRKRACLDPCGHTSACIDCATKAWEKKPYCPWCKASIQKPISIPAQIFL